MTDHERGQVDVSAARVYDDLFVPALFGRFAERVVELARLKQNDSVLDIACGTGAFTRAVRRRTGGRVMGVDSNPAMLAVAREHGGHITYGEADALALPAGDREFDVATCQFGLMFFPDPVLATGEMVRVAGRGLIAVWDSIERSEGYAAMQELFRDELGPQAAESLDAPFAMGAPGALEDVLARAGIGRADIASIEGTGRFDSIGQWVTTEVRGWTLGESVTDQQLADLVAVAEERLARFATPEGCIFGMATRVATWSDAG